MLGLSWPACISHGGPAAYPPRVSTFAAKTKPPGPEETLLLQQLDQRLDEIVAGGEDDYQKGVLLLKEIKPHHWSKWHPVCNHENRNSIERAGSMVAKRLVPMLKNHQPCEETHKIAAALFKLGEEEIFHPLYLPDSLLFPLHKLSKEPNLLIKLGRKLFNWISQKLQSLQSLGRLSGTQKARVV